MDEVTLTLPRRRALYRVAHLVLGGLAVRLDLTFEHLEDLQLALAEILEQPEEDGRITVAFRVESGTIAAAVGPFAGDRLQRELEREPDGEQLTLRRLLETVCDEFRVAERDGGQWIEFSKTVEAVPS